MKNSAMTLEPDEDPLDGELPVPFTETHSGVAWWQAGLGVAILTATAWAVVWAVSKCPATIELEARVETVGQSGPDTVLVRYSFLDPVTKQERVNTTTVPLASAPQTRTAMVDYLPGDYPISRLKAPPAFHARDFISWVNAGFLCSAACLILHFTRKPNGPVP